MEENKAKGKGLVFYVVIALLVIISIVAIYLYRKVNKLSQNPQAVAQEEVKALVEKVGKIILLPKDEEPTIATITDIEKLKGQPFFEKAKQGDKVLIYANSRKVILYDPSQNIIVEVAPLNIGNAGTNTQTTVNTTQTTSKTVVK